MRIISAIQELLMEHPMVVISGFGGFISRDSPASFNKNTGLLKPKSNTCFFNVALKEEDGLLANHIAKAFSISYSTAIESISAETEELKIQLLKNKSFAFGDLGNFYINTDSSIYFTTNSSINFNKNSFGLEPTFAFKKKAEVLKEEVLEKTIIAPAPLLKKVTPTEKPKETKEENYTSLKPIDLDKSNVFSINNFPKIAASILLLVVAGFLLIKTDTFKSNNKEVTEAGLITIDSGESNSDKIDNAEVIVDVNPKKESKIIEEFESKEEFENKTKNKSVNIPVIPAVKETAPIKKDLPKIVAKIPIEYSYYVSMARFINKESAKQYVNNYKHLNLFVEILKDVKSPFYHIIVGKFENNVKAEEFVNNHQEDALGSAKVLKSSDFTNER